MVFKPTTPLYCTFIDSCPPNKRNALIRDLFLLLNNLNTFENNRAVNNGSIYKARLFSQQLAL